MFRPFGTPSTGAGSTNPFGAATNTGTGAFGAAPAASTSGFFGQQQQVQPAQSTGFAAGGMFGSGLGGATSTTTSGFGGMTAGTGFGAAAPMMTAGTGNPPYTSTSDTELNVTIHLYCISAMPAYRNKSLEELRLEDYMAGKKCASGFSSTPATTSSPFGFGGAPATSTTTGGFGAAPAAIGGFGFGKAAPVTTSATGFGAGAFGQQPAQPAFGGASASFGGFGAAAAPAAAPSMFGQPQQQQQGMFGATAPAGGLFGQPAPAAPPAATPFGFGTPAQQPAQTNPFGASSFGAPTSTPATTGGMFGAKPAAPSFGFGSTAPAAPAAANPFSFGQPATPAAPAAAPSSFSFGGFGQANTAPATPATAGFSFGGASQAAPAATASTGGFSFGTAPSAAGTSTMPAGGLTFPSAATKPLGFSLGTPNTGTAFGGFASGLSSTTAATATPGSILPLIAPPDARLLSLKPPLPAGLASKERTTAPTAIPTPSATPAKPSEAMPARVKAEFIPRGGFRLKANEPATSTTSGGLLVPRTSAVKRLNLTRTSSTSDASADTKTSEKESEEPTGGQHYGDYYMIPSISTLKRMSYSQLASVSNFTVGQRGVGSIRFLRPVDLTSLDLDSILDHIVVFAPSQVVLYPEDEFAERPPLGTGLNQPAEVKLERCWPTSRSSRDPITEMGGERMRRHIERLKAVDGTHFVDFVPESGTWVFTVDHF